MTYGLLVEDNPADAGLIQEGLSETGHPYPLVHVLDIGPAREHLAAHSDDPPSIVLLDLNLPSGSGLELLREVRDDPRHADLPVMVLTSSDRPADIEEALVAGATTYYVKPRDLEGYMRLGDELVRFWTGA